MKASVMARRYNIRAVSRAILSATDISNRSPNIVVLAVDNGHARHTVADALEANIIDNIIDSRSEGSIITVWKIHGTSGMFTKWKDSIGPRTRVGRSCQIANRLSVGKTDAGNAVAAAVAVQYLSRYLLDDQEFESNITIKI